MLPIVTFDKTFIEIPEQDNPIYGNEEGIVICRSGLQIYEWQVTHVNKSDGKWFSTRGVFLDLEDAELFAKSLAKLNENP